MTHDYKRHGTTTLYDVASIVHRHSTLRSSETAQEMDGLIFLSRSDWRR